MLLCLTESLVKPSAVDWAELPSDFLLVTLVGTSIASLAGTTLADLPTATATGAHGSELVVAHPAPAPAPLALPAHPFGGTSGGAPLSPSPSLDNVSVAHFQGARPADAIGATPAAAAAAAATDSADETMQQ